MRNNLEQKSINFAQSLEEQSESYDVFILFIDLCESTSIKQYCLLNEIPDSVWIMRQKSFLSRTATIIQSYNGTIVKTIGDEVMATFSVSVDPTKIIKCVIEVFQSFENLKSFNKGPFKIYSKASIDFGSCYDGGIMKNGVFDPIGTSVDRCARINKFAGKNEVIYSEPFNEILRTGNSHFYKGDENRVQEDIQGLGRVTFYKTSIS